MISVTLANRRIKKPLKGCEYFCKTQLNDHIIGCGDESNNEDEALFGFNILSIDSYFQEKFRQMFGDVTVWIGSDYKVNKLTEYLA